MQGKDPTTNVCLRIMQPADEPEIARLSEEGFKDSYPFDWSANASALRSGCEAGRVFVGIAEIGNEVVGYCNLRSWPGGGWIDQIVISGNHQRKGLGRILLDYVLSEAIKRGFWKVSLIVSEAEERTLRFYRSCGFEQEGVLRDQIRRGTHGILMSRLTDYSLHPNQ